MPILRGDDPDAARFRSFDDAMALQWPTYVGSGVLTRLDLTKGAGPAVVRIKFYARIRHDIQQWHLRSSSTERPNTKVEIPEVLQFRRTLLTGLQASTVDG